MSHGCVKGHSPEKGVDCENGENDADDEEALVKPLTEPRVGCCHHQPHASDGNNAHVKVVLGGLCLVGRAFFYLVYGLNLITRKITTYRG